MSDTSLTVIGAGAVGLAIAARMVEKHPDLILLDRNEHHGMETSSRNSEVIHAGMYYPTGSLKAVLCVEGNRMLYEYCDRREVSYNRCAKIIVAMVPEEVAHLEKILAIGRANGVALEMISGEKSRELEPHVPAVAALFSPNTGVISAHGLMDALLHDIKIEGGTFQSSASVVGLERSTAGDYKVSIDTPGGVESFTSERVINAAGLDCDTIAGLAGIDLDAAGYRLHYCKGSYFAVTGPKARYVSRLVYPVPTQVSLGLHALVDVAGRVRFGPDAEFIDRVQDYRVTEDKRARFAEGVRRLVPEITDDDLTPDISGIRPKVQAPGEPMRDFIIREESDRGLPGLISLIGIESPGLTSCLAIARHVEELL